MLSSAQGSLRVITLADGGPRPLTRADLLYVRSEPVPLFVHFLQAFFSFLLWLHRQGYACAKTLASLASGLALALASKFPIIPKGVLWEWFSANGQWPARRDRWVELWGIMGNYGSTMGNYWELWDNFASSLGNYGEI